MPTQTLERPAQERTTTEEREQKRRKSNRGNFANDPSRAREAGRKGGKARGKNR